MNAMWSEAKAKVSHRLATHLRVEPFRLRNETPMVSFTFDDIPKSAATTGAANSRRSWRARHLLCFGRPCRHHVAELGRRSMPRTSLPCTARATKSAATPFPTSGPAISTRRRWPARSRATAAISGRSIPRSRPRNFAYPFGYGSFVRKRQLKTEFKSCRSIVPGVNSGTVDLQFLRALAADRPAHRPRRRSNAPSTRP